MAVEFSSHQVEILFDSDPNPICAGTLISSYLVLTVFSCLKGKNETKLKVRSSQKDAAGNFQIRNVETIHSFPALKSKPLENDIAVILLESDFNLDDSLSLIGRDSNEPQGFIALSSSASSSSTCGSFPVEKTDQSDCNRTTDNPHLICVKPSNKSSCPLPFPVPLIGSGLICQVHGLHFLCGALAGNGTNWIEYTDISTYLNWIRLTFDTHLNGNGDSGHEHELVGVVFGGREVSASGVSTSIPYQLSLQDRRSGNWSHICGAVIIDTKTALSAAHCFKGTFEPSDFQVVAGVTHLNSSSSTRQILPLQRIIRHHGFKNIFNANDITVLHVNGSFVYNENVGNIWISPPNGTNPTDFRGRVSGWGQISGIKQVSNSLQEADMKILPDEECKQTWPFLKPSMICSYENKSNTCKGDSGGPLVIQNYQFNKKTKRDLLIGIASFSHIDCEKREMPNAFTEVSHFYNWIKKNRASKCGDNEFQCLNGGCIDECSLCNGADECGDGSTEKQCEQEMDVSKMRRCLRKNQEELKNKSKVEEMLLDFVQFLAPNQTEPNNVTTRAERLQVVVDKYENKTKGAFELIQTMDNTLKVVENQTQRVDELKRTVTTFQEREDQWRNWGSFQTLKVRTCEEQKNNTLIQLEERDKDVENKGQRIQNLEQEKERLEMSVKEWQNLTISHRESLERTNGQMKNLSNTLSQKTANCTPKDPTITPAIESTTAVLPGRPQTPGTETSTARSTTLTTTEKEQSRPVGPSAAAAWVTECDDSYCGSTTEWQYDATRDGSCKPYSGGIKSIQLTGSCVTLYRNNYCSGRPFQLNTENSEKGQDVRNQFSYKSNGYTRFNGPRSIGPC